MVRGLDGIFDYIRPVAGAIVFAHYRLPVTSAKLVERIRERCSVLLVPGDLFRAGKGIRFGFGYDVQRTLEGLALVRDVLLKEPAKKARSPVRAAARRKGAPRASAGGSRRA